MAAFSISFLMPFAWWAGNVNKTSQITGFPDNRAFKWTEGCEVKKFIHRYMEYKGWNAEQTFCKLETTIKTRLPFSAKTHHDVMEWLDVNFKK